MCGPPISQSAWMVRRRVSRSRYSDGIFRKSFGSMRSVNCANATYLLTGSGLAAELPVLGALHERPVDDLVQVDGRHLVVRLGEDLHRGGELVGPRERVGRRHFLQEEVIRALHARGVLALEVLLQDA